MDTGKTMREALRDQLLQGMEKLGVVLDRQKLDGLLDYLNLLHKWNKAYNLTAVRDIYSMVSRHLLDSLSLIPFVEGEGWLDVGSGGGLPGIPLSVVFPDKKFTLLDGNGKKTRFLTQVQLELGLDNVEVIQARVENFHPESPFSGIVSRAFSSLADFTGWTAHLGDNDTRWLAMKGLWPEEELGALSPAFVVEEEQRLHVPGCEGQRHLVILRRQTDADQG